MSLSLRELERYAAALAAAPERWQHLVRHLPDRRIYDQICDEPEVNAWVICWSEAQDTGFHDHDQSGAGIAVISGRVREERLRVAAAPQGRELGRGSVLSVPPVAIHRVLHVGKEPAVTIHAYSPPLSRTGAYRFCSTGELERESQPLEAELLADPVAPYEQPRSLA